MASNPSDGSPPPQVEVEVEGGDSNPPPYQQENNKREKVDEAALEGGDLGEKEKEAVDGGGLFDPQPPIGILKKSSYVSGEESEAEQVPTNEDSKQEGKKGKKRRRKLVPVWRLFRFADFWDFLMIILGTVMAVAAGLALPGHIILFGDVINEFVFHGQAENLLTSMNDTMANRTEHFCNNSDSGEVFTMNVGRYIPDPDAALLPVIGRYALYYVALASGVLIATFLATVFWNISAYRQTRRMRMAFYHSILRQEIGWFDVNEANELSTRLADDIEKIQSGIGDKVALFLQYFSTFIAGFVIGYFTSWKLALVVSVMLPILSLMAALIAKIIASFTVREQGAYAAAGGVAEEVLSSIRTVVAFGGEQKEAERYGEQLKLARNEGVKKGFFSSLVVGGLYLVIFSTYALAYWYGSTLIIACELSAGDVVTALFAVIIGSFSLGNALPELETFATALGSATVVFEVIDREPEIDWDSDEGETPDHLEGNIKFSDVVFNYPARPDVQILHGLDLEIKKGQTVALVGPSGCGKSTVIQLIQRFYNPLGGQITLDGREIRTLNLQWLRNHIGVVSQEPVLFNTTIAENIRYGREDATMDDIIQAAKNANAHDFISQLPDGYDTDVGERGAQMSGGQKQRIAIARALVRDPKILLLDEATSALDNQSEKVVQDALDKAREGRTTIVIAHRLSTIQTADTIIAISDGRVAESGSHSELMDKEGLYYELVTAQTIDEQEEQSQEPLAGFRAAVKRSFSKRQESITSGGGRDFMRQVSTMSQLSQDDVFASGGLTDNLSRFSIEDIPVVASPSPYPGRSTFPGPVDTLEDKDEDDLDAEGSDPEDEDTEVTRDEEAGEIHHRRSTMTKMLRRRHRTKKEKLPTVPFRELLKLNKPDWHLVLLGVICSAIIGCLFPLMAVLFRDVLAVFGSTDPQEIEETIKEIAGGFVGLAVGASVVYFLANFSLAIAGERLTKRLRYLSFKAMLRQEIAWFDQKVNSTGALATRLASDASEVKGATGIRLGTILQTICGLIAATAIAFSASWELTLVLMFAFPVLALAGYFQIRLLRGRSQKNKKKMEESGQTAVESIDNIRTLAGLGVEPRFYNKYSDLLLGPFKSNVKSVFVQATVLGVGQSLIFYLYAAGFYFGAFLVTENRTTYDALFQVFAAVVFTALSIGRASSFAPDASKAQVSAAKIIALLNRKPQIDASSSEGIKLDKPTGDINVNSVHFNYPTRPEVKVLQGLSVSVKPGQTLALVGPSGCGKSTIVSLVERFYDPVTGNVTLEGTDLRDLNLSWLRRQIGIVSQEPVLFDATIAENIRYGALYRQVTDEEVIEAAKSANIHTFIDSLPQGYSTNVGAKGTQLSGGQKQRIAIARAIVRDPKILLLDEATSALDTESEKVVQEALDKAREGRTSIVIAHRLSTIYNSDIIAVIHNGQVIESGTHAQLMAKKGAYYLLNTVQLEDIQE